MAEPRGRSGADPDHPTDHRLLLDRREAIRRVGWMLGGVAVVGGSGLLAACERRERPSAGAGEGVGDFRPDEVALLDEVADTILPDTDTPGAKAAEVGAFIALMVTDTYDDDERAVFRAGMETLDAECRSDHGVGFMEADGAQRLALLERLDREQVDHEAARSGEDPVHYFRMIKELTLLGYFTSEVGCRQAQQYVESPGRYEPCLQYTPGDRSWASHA